MKSDDKSTSGIPCDYTCCCRREFLQTAGASVGAMAILSAGAVASGDESPPQPRVKKTPTVLGAFVYTPSEQLKKEGYWSWPGSSFDPEGRQREYVAKIKQVAGRLNVRIEMEPKPLADDAAVSRFIDQAKHGQPDGLLLFLFKKFLHKHVERILDETNIPAVVCLPLGTLLIKTIQRWQGRDALHLIGVDRGFDAVSDGVRMFRTARWMKDARLINVNGTETRETDVPHLGTQVRTVPHAQFYKAFRDTTISPEVQRLARAYRSRAQEVVEPNPNDLQEAARCYFALKRLLQYEHGDALMMDCLPGLSKPHKHVPPCMGFMSLHDEGIVAGCQSDLEATLTMMLGSHLLETPGFMHNPSWDMAGDVYFGAHCTCPSKMGGLEAVARPYILRSHNEAGWGCVPQVLFPEGQTATMAHYFPDKEPRMIVYTGRVIRSYPKLPGGCRTNFAMKIDGVDEAARLACGGHQVLFFGDHGQQLKAFCKLHGIEVIGA